MTNDIESSWFFFLIPEIISVVFPFSLFLIFPLSSVTTVIYALSLFPKRFFLFRFVFSASHQLTGSIRMPLGVAGAFSLSVLVRAALGV